MSSEVLKLAILLTVKDIASGKLKDTSQAIKGMDKDMEGLKETAARLGADFGKGLSAIGTGFAGLQIFRKGIDVAADFQFSLTDLRATLAQTGKDGAIDLNRLGEDMQKAEVIALKLGNALPGTTEDFVQMMTVMKQNGLDTTTIFNGAAEAVGQLAVANNQLPKDVAKDFAQFGQLFQLKPDEYVKAADTFSRLFTSTGIESGELIQASKYFQGRSGSAIGLTGLKDAESTVRLIGLMRKQGMEGTMAGTGMSTFFSSFLTQKDKAVADLRKETGIDLKLFDKTGKFAGIDNLFKQLEPLQKLSEEDRTIRMKKIFGDEGMAVATAILKTGTEGWKQYNAEQDKTVSLADKNAMKSKDYINQMEALTGSMKNVVVQGFEPWLSSMGRGAEIANEWVGGLQDFMKAHPHITATATGLLGIGSAALIVGGSIKSLIAVWRMWRLVSAISRGDSLIPYLNQTKTASDAAGTSIVTTTSKAKGLRGALKSQTVQIGVSIAAVYGIDFLINSIAANIQKAVNVGLAQKQHIEGSVKHFDEWKRINKEMTGSGMSMPQENIDSRASTAWFTAKQMGLDFVLPSLATKRGASENIWHGLSQTGLAGIISKAAGATNPFATGYAHIGGPLNNYNQQSLSEGFKKMTPELADPRIMASFLRQIETRVPDETERATTKKALMDAFPASFSEAAKELAGISFVPLTESFAVLSEQANMHAANTEVIIQNGQALGLFNETLTGLNQPLTLSGQSISQLGDQARRVPPALNQVVTSSNAVANSLNAVSTRMSNWQPSSGISPGQSIFTRPEQQVGSPFTLPSRAIGGVVERDGLAMVHAGNVISPARVTKGHKGSDSAVNINYSPNITINGNAASAKDEFRQMLHQHGRDLEVMVSRAMENRRVRS